VAKKKSCAAFASAVQQSVDAILVISDAILIGRGDQIAALEAAHGAARC
jgi:hypothetical protein